MNKLKSIWQYRKVRRITLVASGCAGFLAGMGLVQAGLRLEGMAWLGCAALLLFACWHKKAPALVAAVLAGVVLGNVRGAVFWQELQYYQPFVGQKVEVIGTVVDDSVYGDKGQHDFKLTNVNLQGRSPPGQVRVTSFSPVGPKRGDVVRVAGKLYGGFGSYQVAIYFSEITVAKAKPPPLEQLRRHFAAAVYNSIPEPQASLGLGFLLGIKSQLPDDLSDELKVLALTHIVVASGYNLTILVRLSRRLLARVSKYQAMLASATLMVGFVAITGFSPSMSRAALVSGLSLAAWYYGRRAHPVTLLLFAAAATAAINPLYLWVDIGWWLSFLAFAGVLILAPLLQRRIFGSKRPRFVAQIVIETIAAQLVTLPLTLVIFGSLSVLSLLANVLVVPLIPLAMAGTFAAGAVGLFLPAVAAYIALPATWLMTYMTSLVHALASLPWAAVELKITVAAMVGCYAGLFLFCMVLHHRTGHDFMGRNVVE